MKLEILLYTVCIILIFINISYYTRQPNPWRTALIGMGSGAAALVPLHFLLGEAGVPLALNGFTLLASMALGVPGVALLLADSLLF